VANKFTISTVFTAVDKMTSTVKSIGNQVAHVGALADKAGKDIKKAFEPAGKMMLAVGAAGAAAGVAVFGLANKAADAAASVMDTANAIGMSTKALQEYRYVAAMSGMETSDMDAALSKLTINLGKGGDAMEATLGMLGLTMDQLRSARPDQVLELVAEGMKGVKDSTTKAAITTALFGKSSVRMVNALSGGADGIQAMREEAQAAGYVMDETALKSGAGLNDAMDRLKLTFDGFANSLGMKIVPQIQALVDKFSAALRPGGQMSKLVDALGNGLVFMAGVVVSVVEGLAWLYSVLEPFSPVIIAVVAALGTYVMIMNAIKIALGLATAAQIAMTVAMNANPISLIISGIAVLVGIIIALALNWDSVVAALMSGAAAVGSFFAGVWDGIAAGFTAAFDLIKIGLFTVADIILTVYGGLVKAVLGAVSVVGSAIGINMSGVDSVIAGIAKVQADVRAQSAIGGAKVGGSPASSQAAAVSSNTTSTSKVEVTFTNPPMGTAIKQTGAAPGVTLATGNTSDRVRGGRL
jgi:hypothetical protein